MSEGELSDDDHGKLVERIKSARAALRTITDPEQRNAILDELGAATLALANVILKKEGRLKSPLE